MTVGLVMSLPPIRRLPELYQVLVRKERPPKITIVKSKVVFTRKIK